MFRRLLSFNYLKHLSCLQNFSTSLLLSNHYNALGITPAATQTEIKAAYYKLSMQYHPDKNKGSTEASKKFQDISAAYEVLGNYKLRKLYDKGILQTSGAQYGQEGVVVEDHPEEKFYRSREKRHKAPTSGRTPIYDFDGWSKAHYGYTFERQHKAKLRYQATKAKMKQEGIDIKNEMTIMAIMSIFIVFVMINYITEEGYDVVKTRKNNNTNTKQN